MSTQSEADDSEAYSDVCVQCGQVFETYDHPRDGFVCSDCRGVKVGDDLWFCENCTHVFSGVAVVDTQAISQGRTRLDMIGRVAPHYEALETEGYHWFSDRLCDCCGTSHGGSRHRHVLCDDRGVKVGFQFRAIGAGECFVSGHTYTVSNTYNATDGAPLMDLTSEILDTTIAGVRVDDPALESLGATAEGAAVVARIHARYERNPDE